MGRHFQQGIALYQLDKNREAIDAFTRELAEDNQNVAALAMRGAALIACGKVRQAEEDVLGAISLEPEYSYAFYLLSIVHYRLQGPRAALKAINEALRLDHNPVYIHQLGALYFDTNRYAESLKAAEEALALDASDEDSNILRAKSLSALGRGEEARDVLRFALSLRADNPEAHKELGSLILRSGRAEDALEHLLEARRIDPIKHNDRLALAAAYGRLFWPFSVLDAWMMRWRRCSHLQRWLCVVGVATFVLLVMLWTGTDEWKPSILAGMVLVLVANAIVLRFTLEWIARVVAVFRLRRALDLGWRHLSESTEDLTNIVIAHGLSSGAAVGAVFMPALAVAAMSMVVLGWDVFPLLWKLPKLLAIPLSPAAAFGIVVAATYTAIWTPNFPATVLSCWAGIVVGSFVVLLARIFVERRLGLEKSK